MSSKTTRENPADAAVQPSCRKSAYWQPGATSTDDVQNVVAESDLTRRAREVLAKPLSEWQSIGPRFAPGKSGTRPDQPTWNSLLKRGLVQGHIHPRASTDLGREVARLIAAANAEVGNG